METKQNKQLRELSEEELEKVTGGQTLPITPISQITPGDEDELARGCGIKICPPGYQLDRSLNPCRCVEEPNTSSR